MKPKFIVYKAGINEIAWISPNEESLEFILNRAVPSGSKYLFINDDTNVDYDFFKSYDFDWNLENGTETTPILNLDIAKQMYLKEIRIKRDKLFVNLDIDYMRALETGNQTLIQEIVTKKQQLRDLPNMDFSDVTTSVQLKAKWPSELLGNSPYSTI